MPHPSSQLSQTSLAGLILVGGGGLPVVVFAILHLLLWHPIITVALGTVALAGVVLLLLKLSFATIGFGGELVEKLVRRDVR